MMARSMSIYWSPTGNPRRKIYFDESAGVPIQDIWYDFRDTRNQNVHITGYPTEKNPDLLDRIIKASSNPGDLVLDCFSGSGTTLAVAEQLGRKWIGIDNSREAIVTTLQRFSRGTKRMGDYVNRDKIEQDGMKVENLMLDLFDDELIPHSKSHTMIGNFAIYANETDRNNRVYSDL